MTSQIISLNPTTPDATVNLPFSPNLISCLNLSVWPLVINYSAALPDETSYDLYLPGGMSTVFPALGRGYSARLLVTTPLPDRVLPCYLIFSDGNEVNNFGQLIDPVQGVNVTMLVRMTNADFNTGDQTMAAGFFNVLHTYIVPVGYFGVLRACNMVLGPVVPAGASVVQLYLTIDGFYTLILDGDKTGTYIKSDRLSWEVPLQAGTVLLLHGQNSSANPVPYAVSWHLDLIPLT